LEFDVGEMSQSNRPTRESITTGLYFLNEHGVTPNDSERPNVSPLSEGSPDIRMPNHHATPSPTNLDAVPDDSTVVHVAEAMKWVICSIFVERCAPHFKCRLGDIPSHLRIPVIQTTHYPAFAMQSKCSENDGNIEVLDQMMMQSSITEEIEGKFRVVKSSTPTVANNNCASRPGGGCGH
jgi:hypothetical protein